MEEKTKSKKFKLDKEKLELVLVLTSVIAFIYPILNYLYNFLYQKDCEKFYHINGTHFHTSINNWILYLGAIGLLFLMCFVPVFSKKFIDLFGDKSWISKVVKWIIPLYMGFLIGVVNIDNFVKILRKIDGSMIAPYVGDMLNKIGAPVIVGIVILISVLSVVGVALSNRIDNIKKRRIRAILNGIVCFFLFLNLLILVMGTYFTLTSSVKDKRNYEVVSYEESNFIILSEKEESLLVAKYAIENGRYQIYTKEYYFIEKETGEYSYIEMKQEPRIVSDMTFEESVDNGSN